MQISAQSLTAECRIFDSALLRTSIPLAPLALLEGRIVDRFDSYVIDVIRINKSSLSCHCNSDGFRSQQWLMQMEREAGCF